MKRSLWMILLMIGLGNLVSPAQTTNEEKQLIRARFLALGGHPIEALNLLNQTNPSSGLLPAWKLAKASALGSADRLDQAINEFLEVKSFFPAEATYRLAGLYANTGRQDEAIRYLSEHLALPDHYPEKTIKLDTLLNSLENSREWVALWQKDWYSQAEQDFQEVRYLIGNEHWEEALSILQNLPEPDKSSAESLFLEGSILYLRGEKNKAVRLFEQASPGMQKNELLLTEALDFYSREQLDELAGQMLIRLQQIDPTNPDYYLSKALLMTRTLSTAAVVNEIKEVLEIGLKDAELLYSASTRIEKKNPDQAIALLTEAISSGTLDARCYHLRGLLRCRESDLEGGLADLAMSLDIDPRQPQLYLERGTIRLDSGDSEGACHDWKQALKLGSSQAADLLYKHCR